VRRNLRAIAARRRGAARVVAAASLDVSSEDFFEDLELGALVQKVADELKIKSPFDPP
jgi:hypothetical protein